MEIVSVPSAIQRRHKKQLPLPHNSPYFSGQHSMKNQPLQEEETCFYSTKATSCGFQMIVTDWCRRLEEESFTEGLNLLLLASTLQHKRQLFVLVSDNYSWITSICGYFILCTLHCSLFNDIYTSCTVLNKIIAWLYHT